MLNAGARARQCLGRDTEVWRGALAVRSGNPIYMPACDGSPNGPPSLVAGLLTFPLVGEARAA
jgi:hypothetical protein